MNPCCQPQILDCHVTTSRCQNCGWVLAEGWAVAWDSTVSAGLKNQTLFSFTPVQVAEQPDNGYLV